VSLSKRKAGLVAAAAIAASVAATPLSAHEQSFSALEGIDAQPLSTAEMDDVHGQAFPLAVAALLKLAAKIEPAKPQAAATLTKIATALDQIKIPTQKIFIHRTLVRR